tara:strand:- start:193 stop:891 length:699 start_codon:yes stop_codon:yes gene_type:complete
MQKKVSIILTTYNEADFIENTINQIFKHIHDVEIILIDDNSTDGTLEKVKSINNPNLIIFSRKSRGLASAFLLGLINSSSEIVGWVDSNMPYLIKNYPKMISKLVDNDIVILSRYIDGSTDERNKFRIFASYFLNKFSKIVLRSKINDLTSGLFVMKRNVLTDATPIAYGHGEWFVEFLYRAEQKNRKILELPYNHHVDITGNSKTFPNLFRFSLFGLFYVLRLFRTLFKRT